MSDLESGEFEWEEGESEIEFEGGSQLAMSSEEEKQSDESSESIPKLVPASKAAEKKQRSKSVGARPEKIEFESS